MLTDLLRAQTRSRHERLEELNELPCTPTDYLTQLATFYGFIAPWEAKLARALPAADPIRQGRAKAGWLEADLAYFGFDPAQIAALPRAAELPSTASRPEILGAAYVLEGSTLGGQFIAEHLERTLGLRDGEGYRYFRSYGPTVGAQWQAFRAVLLQASSPQTDDVVVHAACRTFDLLQGWFSARRPVAA